MPAITLIDNYDSFTFNLAHYLGALGAEVSVWRNDEISVAEVLAGRPDAIVLSPGPATPNRPASASIWCARRARRRRSSGCASATRRSVRCSAARWCVGPCRCTATTTRTNEVRCSGILFHQAGYHSRCSFRRGGQQKSLSNGRKSTSRIARKVVVNSQYRHVRFHLRLGRTIGQRKNHIKLDGGICRGTSGGHDKYAIYTHVPGGAFALEALAFRPHPIENRRGVHSIPLGPSSFRRPRRILRNVK